MKEQKDIIYMHHAIKYAKLGMSLNEVPVGAIIVLNNEIISAGYNQPINANNPIAHAEIIALQIAAKFLNNYRLSGTTLYVTLEPCIMCIGAMINARIKRLVFDAFNLKNGKVTSSFQIWDKQKLNHTIQYNGGVLSEECGKLLSIFFQKKRYLKKINNYSNTDNRILVL